MALLSPNEAVPTRLSPLPAVGDTLFGRVRSYGLIPTRDRAGSTEKHQCKRRHSQSSDERSSTFHVA